MTAENHSPTNLEKYKKRIPIDVSHLPGMQQPVWMEYYEIDTDKNLPWVLLTYQIHPDENMAEKAVVDCLNRVVPQMGMPNILFVPQGSPTGIARLQTSPEIAGPNNLNGLGHDLNWSFSNDSRDPEVLAWMELLKDKKFAYSLHIHHDYGMFGKQFYGYIHDYYGSPRHFDWDAFTASLSQIGFSPFADQIDDPLNKALDNKIPADGLIPTHPDDPHKPKDIFAGSFENWLVENGKVQWACTFELPYDLHEKDSFPVLDAIYSGVLNTNTGFVLK